MEVLYVVLILGIIVILAGVLLSSDIDLSINDPSIEPTGWRKTLRRVAVHIRACVQTWRNLRYPPD